MRCVTRGAAVGVAHSKRSGPARSRITTFYKWRVVLRAAVRGPAPHGAERPAEPVLWVGRARPVISVDGRRISEGAWLPRGPREEAAGAHQTCGTTTLHKEAPVDGRRAGRAARGADLEAPAQEEDCGNGAPAAAPHFIKTAASGRTVGRRARRLGGRPRRRRGGDRVRPRARRRAARARGLRAARGRRLLPRPNTRRRRQTSDE